MSTLSLYNTLSRKKDEFRPLDAKNVRMYVCGPTVYDRPHIGNARSVVIYDVLYRLLTHLYGEKHVTYVRNITDVDDKINAAAKHNGETISALTERVTGWFHDDMAALGCLRPNIEPRATAHIAQMIHIIEQLIANGHAYVSQGHALFRVASFKEYGALSGRKLDDLIAGARIEVESYKEHPGDFVLWKPADAGDDPSSVFESPWGAGRPGWHIECSAMSSTYLGAHFDIHGGGADLMFPHHENEIAQSKCADPAHNHFANYWVHNGFLTVNGEKMSKSLGNFITVKDLLDKGVRGEVIRLVLLSAKYNEPLDWNEKLVSDAKLTLDKWYRSVGNSDLGLGISTSNPQSPIPNPFLNALGDDLNLPKAFSLMHASAPEELFAMGKLLGFFGVSADEWFKGDGDDGDIQAQIDARIEAKKAKNWQKADGIRQNLAKNGIILEDRPDGTTDWRRA
ncbi:MAG: cysteine--tRNA ligase [Alphaproteobacteria bacterium]|nr:cysteine--tRNA ligase [Alphaproteobacteria bacterium]